VLSRNFFAYVQSYYYRARTLLCANITVHMQVLIYRSDTLLLCSGELIDPLYCFCAITEIWNFHLADVHTYYCWFPSLLMCILTISELKACLCAIERLLITSFASVQKIIYWAVPLLLCKCSIPCQYASFLLLLITFLAYVHFDYQWVKGLLLWNSRFVESFLCAGCPLLSNGLAVLQICIYWHPLLLPCILSII
jgi:hypothetical protein